MGAQAMLNKLGLSFETDLYKLPRPKFSNSILFCGWQARKGKRKKEGIVYWILFFVGKWRLQFESQNKLLLSSISVPPKFHFSFCSSGGSVQKTC